MWSGRIKLSEGAYDSAIQELVLRVSQDHHACMDARFSQNVVKRSVRLAYRVFSDRRSWAEAGLDFVFSSHIDIFSITVKALMEIRAHCTSLLPTSLVIT